MRMYRKLHLYYALWRHIKRFLLNQSINVPYTVYWHPHLEIHDPCCRMLVRMVDVVVPFHFTISRIQMQYSHNLWMSKTMGQFTSNHFKYVSRWYSWTMRYNMQKEWLISHTPCSSYSEEAKRYLHKYQANVSEHNLMYDLNDKTSETKTYCKVCFG